MPATRHHAGAWSDARGGARRDGAQQRKGWGGRDTLQGSWRVVLGCKPGSSEQLTACCCQALVHWRCSRHSSRWRSARSRGHLLLCAPPPHSVPFFHLDTLQGILTAVVDGIRGSNRMLMTRTLPRCPYRCASQGCDLLWAWFHPVYTKHGVRGWRAGHSGALVGWTFAHPFGIKFGRRQSQGPPTFGPT